MKVFIERTQWVEIDIDTDDDEIAYNKAKEIFYEHENKLNWTTSDNNDNPYIKVYE